VLEERVDPWEGLGDVRGSVADVEVPAALDPEQLLGLLGLGVESLGLDFGRQGRQLAGVGEGVERALEDERPAAGGEQFRGAARAEQRAGQGEDRVGAELFGGAAGYLGSGAAAACVSLFTVSSCPVSEEAGDGFDDRVVAGDGVAAGMFEDQRVREPVGEPQ
jgi:hypothetical protein